MARLVDRFGPRRMTAIVVVLLGGACMAFAGVPGLAWLALGFAALRFLGQGSLMLNCSNLVAQWFSRRRGFASPQNAGRRDGRRAPGVIMPTLDILMAGSLDADWDVPYERLALPVLVMTGLHGRVFHVAADVADLTARMPHARTITFPDAGHLVPVERPRAFAQALSA